MQHLSNLKYPPQNYKSMTIDDGGFAEFGELFRQLRSHWVKVEFLQEYDETGSKAYESFIRGDYDDAKRRVTKDVKSQWVYEHSKQYNVSMTRIRVVKYPISRYLLRFEYHAYVADEEMGDLSYRGLKFQTLSLKLAFLTTLYSTGKKWLLCSMTSIHRQYKRLVLSNLRKRLYVTLL